MAIVFGCVSALVSEPLLEASEPLARRHGREAKVSPLSGAAKSAWRARYTTPIPPSPIFSSSVYCPISFGVTNPLF